MTTTIPTPYDAEIAEHKGLRETSLYVGNLQSKAEGYRRAKAEDAALLEALKEARDCLGELIPQHAQGEEGDWLYNETGNMAWVALVPRIDAAIAQATPKAETP